MSVSTVFASRSYSYSLNYRDSDLHPHVSSPAMRIRNPHSGRCCCDLPGHSEHASGDEAARYGSIDRIRPRRGTATDQDAPLEYILIALCHGVVRGPAGHQTCADGQSPSRRALLEEFQDRSERMRMLDRGALTWSINMRRDSDKGV